MKRTAALPFLSLGHLPLSLQQLASSSLSSSSSVSMLHGAGPVVVPSLFDLCLQQLCLSLLDSSSMSEISRRRSDIRMTDEQLFLLQHWMRTQMDRAAPCTQPAGTGPRAAEPLAQQQGEPGVAASARPAAPAPARRHRPSAPAAAAAPAARSVGAAHGIQGRPLHRLVPVAVSCSKPAAEEQPCPPRPQ